VLADSPLWLSVGGFTTLAFLFNLLGCGGLVFGSVSYRLLPRFILSYAELVGMNFTLLRLHSRLGLGQLSAKALLLSVLAAVWYLGLRGFPFCRLPH
jgi:hypothetical protein